MKFTLLIALFVLVAFSNACNFVTTENENFDYPSVFNDYFSYTEYDTGVNNTFTFTLCPQSADGTATSNAVPCSSVDGAVVAVCEVDSDGYYLARGFASEVQVSYSNNVMDMMYSYNNPILDKVEKTVVSLGCGTTDTPVISITAVDAYFTIISINATFGCQQAVYLDGDWPSHIEISEHSFGFGLIFTILFWLLAFVLIVKFTYCLYWCVTRRRRCVHRQNLQQQYSNVAFQPIPMNNTRQQPQPVMPVVYMPMMNQPQPQVKSNVVEMQNLKSDEQLAREMQAMYDAEV